MSKVMGNLNECFYFPMDPQEGKNRKEKHLNGLCAQCMADCCTNHIVIDSLGLWKSFGGQHFITARLAVISLGLGKKSTSEYFIM